MLRGNWSILSLYIYTGRGVWCVCEIFDIPFYCICSRLVLFIPYSSFFVGASLNVTVVYEYSPLHYAAADNNLEVAQLLLQKGELTFFIEFMTGAYIKMQEASLRSIECVHICRM